MGTPRGKEPTAEDSGLLLRAGRQAMGSEKVLWESTAQTQAARFLPLGSSGAVRSHRQAGGKRAPLAEAPSAAGRRGAAGNSGKPSVSPASGPQAGSGGAGSRRHLHYSKTRITLS